MFAAAWVGYALVVASHPHGVVLVMESWPLGVRVAGWVAPAVLAMFAAVLGYWKAQSFAWAGLVVAPVVRFFSHVWGLCATEGVTPNVVAHVGFMLWWAAITLLIWLSATWPEGGSPDVG